MNCMDCRFHDVIDDPDPHDSFCSHYEAVICHKMMNPKTNLLQQYPTVAMLGLFSSSQD